MRPSETVQEQLGKLRERQGLRQQGLADRVKEIGGSLDRAAIGKIEAKARGVSLDDLFVLAAALRIAPLQLFIPLGKEAVEVTPLLNEIGADHFREWVRGRKPLRGEDATTYFSEVSGSDWALLLQGLRWFDRLVDDLYEAIRDQNHDRTVRTIRLLIEELYNHLYRLEPDLPEAIELRKRREEVRAEQRKRLDKREED
jgi:transcriptional regulator with XRE-family HTH domain